MMKRIALAFLLAALLVPFDLSAQKSSRSASRSSSAKTSSSKSKTSKSAKEKTVHVKQVRKSTVATRDKNGRIKRSTSARNEFMRQTGFPKGRKGYVVDHVVPLECGGADTPSNMQWQTAQQAKIKDRTERNCRR